MSVLSRRLGRFAVGFTVTTFAFFFVGFYAAANNKVQVVFFCAGLVLVCLFASFFLWLAHGFAWAMIPDAPVVAKRPAEALKPIEALKPVEALKPADVPKPVEAMKPAEAKRLVEAMKAAEEKKPVEEKVIAPEEDPPDAKYTITGKRVY